MNRNTYRALNNLIYCFKAGEYSIRILITCVDLANKVIFTHCVGSIYLHAAMAGTLVHMSLGILRSEALWLTGSMFHHHRVC